MSYVETAQTRFRNLDSGPPVVEQDYVFDQIPLPALFSIAVKINVSGKCEFKNAGRLRDDLMVLFYCASKMLPLIMTVTIKPEE